VRGFSRAFAVCLLLFAWVLPAIANAGDESADAEFTITPKSGATFFNNAFSAAQGTVDTVIRLPGPPDDYPKTTPMKVADLRFPPASALTFNPKPSMPVCPDEQLGPPPTTNSIPVPEMIARCPKALIGNGTALFALARNTKPSAARDGELLIFNGGRVGGLPKIKVHSYSYDLQVGIYTSATLQPDGRLLMSGRGVRAVVRVGNIAGGQSRTVTIRAKFRIKGLVRARFRLNTKNAGSKVVARSVRVR